LTLNFSFKNEPNIPGSLQLLPSDIVKFDDMEVSYFISRDVVVPPIWLPGREAACGALAPIFSHSCHETHGSMQW
jgi:K+ transporter